MFDFSLAVLKTLSVDASYYCAQMIGSHILR